MQVTFDTAFIFQQVAPKGGFRGGPRGPRLPLFVREFFSFFILSTCAGSYFELCYLNILSFINIVNKKRICVRSLHFSYSVNYLFNHNHTRGLLNISAFHVQYGIQAFAKSKRPDFTRLHLRELQSHKFSRRSMPPNLPRKVRRSQS